MTNRLELSWKVDGFVDEQRYYCSESPIDPENLPTPKAVLAGDARSYTDYNGTIGKTYNLRIGSVKNNVEKISEEVNVLFGNIWQPSNLNNKSKIWLDSDNVLQSSGLVSQMTDLSGNGYHFSQSQTGMMPTISSELGDSVVSFDGVNDSINNQATLVKDLFRDKQHLWSFCVVRTNIDDNKNHQLMFQGDSTASSRFNVRLGDPTRQSVPSIAVRRLDTDANTIVHSGEKIFGSFMLMFCYANYESGVVDVFINGEKKGTSSISTGYTSDSASATPFFIGSGGGQSGIANPASASIKAVLIGNLSLTAVDRQKLEGWAAHKYGLTDILPVNHPYKTLVPTL